jgi:hypothetical protein
MNLRAFLVPVALAMAQPLLAQDYLGAAEVLSRLEAAVPKAPEPAKPDEQTLAWKQRAAALAKTVVTLAPAEAAQRWLALLDDALKLSPLDPTASPNLTDGTGPWQELFAALPPPAAWDALNQAVKARPRAGKPAPSEFGIRLLAATLHGDHAALPGLMKELKSARKSGRPDGNYLPYVLRDLDGWISQLQDDPRAAVDQFAAELDTSDESASSNELTVPDLVTLDASRAEPLLRRALVTPRRPLTVPIGDATRSLALKLALELIGQSKTPQWGVIRGFGADDLALYEALAKKISGHRGVRSGSI